MSKEVRSMTLDEDVDGYLSRDGVNASGLVNQLVKNHQMGVGQDVQVLKLRRQQLKGEIESAERQLEEKRHQLEVVETQIEEVQGDKEQTIREAAEAIDPRLREPENPAVRNWSQKIGIEPEELLDRIEDAG